jgi:hypothetical protein
MAANRDHHQPEEPQQMPDLTNPAERHERRDVDVYAIGKYGIALALLCIFSFLLLIGVFKFFLSQEAAQPKIFRPNAITDARKQPPEPRLQELPPTDLQAFRAAEDQILHSYGWIDQEKGIVRIPVDKAIDLLAQRGLPSRPAADPQSAAAGVTTPVESGMGPVMTQAGGPLGKKE